MLIRDVRNAQRLNPTLIKEPRLAKHVLKVNQFMIRLKCNALTVHRINLSLILRLKFVNLVNKVILLHHKMSPNVLFLLSNMEIALRMHLNLITKLNRVSNVQMELNLIHMIIQNVFHVILDYSIIQRLTHVKTVQLIQS